MQNFLLLRPQGQDSAYWRVEREHRSDLQMHPYGLASGRQLASQARSLVHWLAARRAGVPRGLAWQPGEQRAASGEPGCASVREPRVMRGREAPPEASAVSSVYVVGAQEAVQWEPPMTLSNTFWVGELG